MTLKDATCILAKSAKQNKILGEQSRYERSGLYHGYETIVWVKKNDAISFTAVNSADWFETTREDKGINEWEHAQEGYTLSNQ